VRDGSERTRDRVQQCRAEDKLTHKCRILSPEI
jgi:hypothetical protein